eukprot:gi/632962600/ref/XP_007897408.1/ PREDICTED: uncharacterized protein LOC103182270 [Callorhinchus milii]
MNNSLPSVFDQTPNYQLKVGTKGVNQSFEMPFRPLDPEEFDRIRHRARTAWIGEHRRRLKSATTYSAEYRGKCLDETTHHRVRPNSPTRLNRPHPSKIFLVTHLHSIPGYYNAPKPPTTSVGRGKHEEMFCHVDGWYKSDARPWTTMNRTIGTTKAALQSLFGDSTTAQAAEAWMKLASEKDRRAVKGMIEGAMATPRSLMGKETPRESYISQALSRSVKPEYVTSVNHWLIKAGEEEIVAVERLLKTLSTDPRIVYGPRLRMSSSDPIWELNLKPRAHDYQIHPEWVTQPWHTQYRQRQRKN